MTDERSLVNETDGIDVADLANVDCFMAENQGQTTYYVDGQTLAQNFPAAVAYGANGVRQVDYEKLIPVLIETIKAQFVIIAALDARVEAAEDAIDAL